MQKLIGLESEVKTLNAALKTRQNVLLIGETGTGKTHIVKAAAAASGRELVRINLDGGTSADQLVGRFQVRANGNSPETYFQEGALVRAMREGCLLLLDEINAALADVLFVLHAVLEQDARLFIAETGEEVRPHADFRIVATMNPCSDYAGTRALNHALYSRFGVVMRFATPDSAQIINIVRAKAPETEEKHLFRIAKTYEKLMELAKADKINTRFSVRECIAAAELIPELGIVAAIDNAMLGKLEHAERAEYSDCGDVFAPASIDQVFAAFHALPALEKKIARQEKELRAFSQLKDLSKAFREVAAQVDAEQVAEAVIS